MNAFRNKLRFITFALLVGFSLASLDDYFFCADGPMACNANSDCCMECQNLHAMNMTKKPLSIAVAKPEISTLEISPAFLYEDPSLFRIERPPIVFIS